MAKTKTKQPVTQISPKPANGDNSVFTWNNLAGSALGALTDPALNILGLYGSGKTDYRRFREKPLDRILSEQERNKQNIDTFNPEAIRRRGLNDINQGSMQSSALAGAMGASANSGQAGSDTHSPMGTAIRAAVAGSQAGNRVSQMKLGVEGQYSNNRLGKSAAIDRNLGEQTRNADLATYMSDDSKYGTPDLVNAMMKGNLTIHQLLGLNEPKKQKVDKGEPVKGQ